MDKNYFMLCYSTTKAESEIFYSNTERFKANIKYDGERIIIVKKGEDIFLFNRNGREKSFIYPEIIEELKKIDKSFIVDGEIITTDGKFNTLQHRVNLKDKYKIQEAIKEYPVVYMIFDVLEFEGIDLKNKPLKDRIKYFSQLDFNNLSKVGYVAYENIEECLNYAENNLLEGIVIKDMEGLYEHRRSKNWLKLKLFKEEEMEFTRYTINNKGIRLEDEKLNAVQVAGRNGEIVKEVMDKEGRCLIVVQYLEKTKDGRLRFPSFKELK